MEVNKKENLENNYLKNLTNNNKMKNNIDNLESKNINIFQNILKDERLMILYKYLKLTNNEERKRILDFLKRCIEKKLTINEIIQLEEFSLDEIKEKVYNLENKNIVTDEIKKVINNSVIQNTIISENTHSEENQLDTGNILVGENQLDSGNILVGENQLDTGNTIVGENQLDTGNTIVGENQLDTGNTIVGENQLDSGNTLVGENQLDSGNTIVGENQLDTDNTIVGENQLDSGNTLVGENQLDSGNTLVGEIIIDRNIIKDKEVISEIKNQTNISNADKDLLLLNKYLLSSGNNDALQLSNLFNECINHNLTLNEIINLKDFSIENFIKILENITMHTEYFRFMKIIQSLKEKANEKNYCLICKNNKLSLNSKKVCITCKKSFCKSCMKKCKNCLEIVCSNCQCEKCTKEKLYDQKIPAFLQILISKININNNYDLFNIIVKELNEIHEYKSINKLTSESIYNIFMIIKNNLNLFEQQDINHVLSCMKYLEDLSKKDKEDKIFNDTYMTYEEFMFLLSQSKNLFFGKNKLSFYNTKKYFFVNNTILQKKYHITPVMLSAKNDYAFIRKYIKFWDQAVDKLNLKNLNFKNKFNMHKKNVLMELEKIPKNDKKRIVDIICYSIYNTIIRKCNKIESII